MSFLVSANPPITGAFTVKRYSGFGIRGADIPTAGDSGGSPVINDGITPDAEYYWRVNTPPASGTVEIHPDLSFDHFGMSVGAWSWVYDLYENGPLKGSWTVTDTSVPVEHSVVVASSQQLNVASDASITQTHLITITGSQQINTESAGSVTQSTDIYLLVANSQQVNIASDAAISQTHLITIGNSQQANIASSVAVSGGSTTVTGSLSDADIARIATAVLVALQGAALPVDVVSVKGDSSITPWPTANQNANEVLNGIVY